MSLKKDLDKLVLEVIGFDNFIRLITIVMIIGFVSGTIIGLYRVNYQFHSKSCTGGCI